MLHGIGVSGLYLLPFAEVLARHGFDVHVIDLPGYGDTPRPRKALSPAELARVVAEYITKRQLKNVRIVGQSMGCQTAVHVALEIPHRCANLVLIGPTVNKEERGLLKQAKRLLQDSFREPFAVNKVIVFDYLRMGPRRFLKTACLMLQDHLEKSLPHVNVPVCLVRGESDPIAPKEWVQYLQRLTKKPTVRQIEGAPHNVQYVKPEELFTQCRYFLEKGAYDA